MTDDIFQLGSTELIHPSERRRGIAIKVFPSTRRSQRPHREKFEIFKEEQIYLKSTKAIGYVVGTLKSKQPRFRDTKKIPTHGSAFFY